MTFLEFQNLIETVLAVVAGGVGGMAVLGLLIVGFFIIDGD